MSEEKSRYSVGGFSPRFVVNRVDGKPCRESARYMVMDGSGADIHATKAIKVYAESVREENSALADDLENMLNSWPVELAQHNNAK